MSSQFVVQLNLFLLYGKNRFKNILTGSYVGLSFLNASLSDTLTSGGRQAVLPEHLQNHGLRRLFQMSSLGKAAGQPGLRWLSYFEVTLMLTLIMLYENVYLKFSL